MRAAARAGRAALRPGQAGDARAADRARRALPALGAGRRPWPACERSRTGPAGRWCSRRSAAATTARASGSCDAPGRGGRGAARPGLPLLAEERVAVRAGSWPCWWRGRPIGQGAAWPVVETVQRDGICREVIAPAPGLSEGRGGAGAGWRCGSPATLDVTGVLAVELFETRGRRCWSTSWPCARTTPGTGPSTARHQPVRAAPAGRAGPAARRPRPDRAVRGDGQRARRRRPGPVRQRTCT